MSTRKNTGKRSIRQNIIISFAVFSLVSLVVVGAISVGFMSFVGTTTTSESTNALKDQIKRNIGLTANQTAQLINQKLENAESMVELLVKETKNILTGYFNYEPGTPYYDYWFQYHDNDLVGPDQARVPSDVHYDEEYKIYLSWSVASYFVPGTTPDDVSVDSSTNDTIYDLTSLNPIFQYIHDNMPEFRWLYIAFQNSGLFVNYPGSVVSGNRAERVSSPFDFRDGSDDNIWYEDIRSGVEFSAPYLDPIDNQPVVTIGKWVNIGGVNLAIAGDISIRDLKEKVVSTKILETGYAGLVDGDGNVVAHPEFTPSTTDESFPTLLDVETSFGLGPALSEAQKDAIISGEVGILEYNRLLPTDSKPQERFLAYTPVKNSGYTCIVIVPVNEAIEPVQRLESRINGATIANMLQIGLVVIATALIATTIGVLVSNRITKPIGRLTSVASRMATDNVREDILGELDVEIDADLEQMDDEVGDLTRAFKGMLMSLQQSERETEDNRPGFFIGDEEEY